MSLSRSCGLLIAALIALPLTVSAQNAPPQCTQPEHRQFDFWVGNWNVTSGDAAAGTNDITLEEDGCVVHEHWVGSKGGTGQSFNFYDRLDKQWHQIWVDNGGTWLNLAGSYADGKMVLIGHNKGPKGKALVQRITWTANADGSVRQLWDTSTDDGKTWTVAFDGTYRKK